MIEEAIKFIDIFFQQEISYTIADFINLGTIVKDEGFLLAGSECAVIVPYNKNYVIKFNLSNNIENFQVKINSEKINFQEAKKHNLDSFFSKQIVEFEYKNHLFCLYEKADVLIVEANNNYYLDQSITSQEEDIVKTLKKLNAPSNLIYFLLNNFDIDDIRPYNYGIKDNHIFIIDYSK